MKPASLFFISAALACAQTPTGAITGVVRDGAGAPVPNARVKAESIAMGMVRNAVTPEHGGYSFPALSPGEYEVSVEASGFQRPVRHAVAEAGSTTTADFDLIIGDVHQSVTVDGSSPQMHYDSHSVGGVVTQGQIESLPLNGRSFLELAKLEPGVQPAVRPNYRTFVPVLGSPGGGNSGRGTRVTLDGSSIMMVGNGGSAMGLSQEAVQEFQISTANFDLSTGLTFSGAINVVTRAGGNSFHGGGVYFLRDHTLAAYPALGRDPANPDPFFQRRQFGLALGGPIERNRLFFFADWERNEQRGVASRTLVGDFARFSGITPSPVFGDQFSVRLDARLSNMHTAFLRHSHDGSRTVGPTGGQSAYPSSWSRQLIWTDQSVLGVTSVLHANLVNDFRFSYFFLSAYEVGVQEQDCPGCLGVGAPGITVGKASPFSIGYAGRNVGLGRRFQLSDSMSWERDGHRLRWGMDWEHSRGGVNNVNNDPVSMTLFAPDEVRAYNAQAPVSLRIPIPIAFNTLSDVLSLPLQTFSIGIGDPRVPQENGSTTPIWNTMRLFFQDTWRARSPLTVNYGLGWNYDGFLNYDLSKPALLAPILGADGLGPTRRQWRNFSPVLGLAWAPAADGKTVIRAGAGIFYDFFFNPGLNSERVLLGPPGLGYNSIPGTAIPNPVPGIPGVAVGKSLDFPNTPTLFTGADLFAILANIRAAQERATQSSDTSVRTIQILKTGTFNPEYLPSWYSLHTNLGVQRQVARDFVVSADFVYRHYIHGPLQGVDLNHYKSVRGPVIPQCKAAAAADPQALCSNGPMNIQTSAARQTYKGLLLRADKRLSRRFQMLGSYAWSRNSATNAGAGFNNDNWLQNVGPTGLDTTHILNLAGVVQLPGHFDLGLNFSYSSAPPLSATVASADFNGDGTSGDLLPGTTVNAFNRGLGQADLVGLVDRFNQTYASTRDAQGRILPRLTLPDHYDLGDNYHSLDLRLSRNFVLHERCRLTWIGEAFNLYNKANLSGYSGDLTRVGFGQATSRATQLFGSGGPRAFQLALKLAF